MNYNCPFCKIELKPIKGAINIDNAYCCYNESCRQSILENDTSFLIEFNKNNEVEYMNFAIIIDDKRYSVCTDKFYNITRVADGSTVIFSTPNFFNLKIDYNEILNFTKRILNLTIFS